MGGLRGRAGPSWTPAEVGTHPGRILPLDFRCPSRLKFLGPCAPRHRRPLALVGGKDDPPFSPEATPKRSSYSWVVTGDHLEAGRQNHGTRWRAFWDPSTGWGSVLGLGRMDPRRDPCPRCLRNVCGAGHHPDKQCLRPRPGARKRARVIAEACEYPQASCLSGPGPRDLSATSLWASTLIGPG